MTGIVGNLPVALTSFVGRQQEHSEVRRLLGRARLVTLTGMGGVGKTRLATEVAAASRKAFADGVWLVDLAPVQQPSAVAGAVAAALRLPDQGSKPVLDQLSEHLSTRRALIVLDNCEHLVDACAQVAQVLLSTADGLRVLATSRHVLGAPGEYVFNVVPLSVPDEAVELLRERAVAVRPGFEIDERNRDAVARLCADLDGVPLAIELAAARLRVLTPEQVAARLEDRFALLTASSRTARPQQRTLRATLDWSFELCTSAEQLLWTRLSVFVGGFTLEAAEEVCSGEGIARHEVLDLLDRLIVQSIVLTGEREDRFSYRMLETVRQYGRARLEASGDEQRVLRRHRDFFLALAEPLADGWCGPGQQEALVLLRADHANLLAVLDCPGDPQTRLRLAAALRFHWCVGGFLTEGRHQLERALAAVPEPTAARAHALWVAAWVALLQGDLAAVERWLDQAEPLGEALDNAVVRGHVQGMRGAVEFRRGRLDRALRLIRDALRWQRASGDDFTLIVGLFELAVIQTVLGDPEAEDTARQAMDAARGHGDRWGLAHALWVLALHAFLRHDLETSTELLRDTLKAGRGLVDYTWTALVLELLACVAASRGMHERAAGLVGTVHALLERSGSSLLVTAPFLFGHHTRCEEEIIRSLGRTAYEKAMAGGVHRATPAEAIDYALGTGAQAVASATPTTPLTRREREVAALVAKGLSNRKIAAELVLSPRTVDGHVENIRAKLGFGSRAQLAAWWAGQEPPTS
ncbi:LuxR C-terminal-related transcriptional regulator [Streptomyces sp. NBC_01275]|nr:LuxR C-terminal-related transcriptional regulator [Streptomyces sp. NBC_01275]